MPLAAEKLQSATDTVLMWVNSGACSCQIEDYMNTDARWQGITEKQIIEIAIANGKVCAICNEKANRNYQAQKATATTVPPAPIAAPAPTTQQPFDQVIVKAIDNAAQSTSSSTGSKGSKGTGSQKPPTV